MSEHDRRRGRFWRYAPLVVWMALIFAASTSVLSGANTSRVFGPLLRWLFPDISESNIEIVHFVVRKAAHFTEYAILALLAARAFATSSHATLRRWLFFAALFLVAAFSLTDELHQSLVATRTGSIYDSLIDIIGGLTALIVYVRWQQKKSAQSINPTTK